MKLFSMARRFIHDPITARELSQLLAASGLTMHEFCRRTGADIRRAKRWLSGEQQDPPLWVASFLVAMQSRDADERVQAWIDDRVVDARTEGDDGE
ncbi:hypothetical protein [Methylobacterium sp. E-045]|uniref:hypothetical protein n=1 Tax=Methylobacterium sp. E-045 TaxID=2836575 RepID=UPI001FBB815C|nr:hypothetical protein [Methylobacterium sp. E-045]MCJ2131592.1 hypothetical protein [Methylobacterium sp. E-045]